MTGLSFSAHNQNSERPPAVAGSFYPAQKQQLKMLVDNFLKPVPVKTPESPRLLISPHAGYVFSGPVAAHGFAHLDNSVKKVFILGPSHYHAFSGFAYPEVSSYSTPLGKVPVDTAIIEKLRNHPKARPAAGMDNEEHCLEVQLPFLQVKLESFTIIPLLAGRIAPEEAASIILPFIDESTIVIASSDLSHYHAQNEAHDIDQQTIANILANKPGEEIDGCGNIPIRIVMALAEKLNLKPLLLDSRTSFETAPQYGDNSRVVGYASIIYVKNLPQENTTEKMASNGSEFTKELQGHLLKIARNSLRAAIHDQPLPHPGELSDLFNNHRGCFVTLTKANQLRGCIGYIEPIKPLYQAIIENARNAALYDNRFAPVRADEIDSLSIEISVLSQPVPLSYKTSDELLRLLRPGIDGVILSSGSHQSTFLPQVWEQLPDKIQFLEHLSIKGGMPKDGWKSASVKIYSVEHFSEK
ncbi:MAG TPA: AmmeMemoRadiSam system protein B, partial [Chitinispirillaceae bacterium]|nr:AmmeMemoRadiSam system protein B [Chitinispirillaceae bacterium]